MLSQEFRHLGVRHRGCQGHRALDIAEERDVGVADRDPIAKQRGGGQREGTALAGAAHRDPGVVHVGESRGGLDCAHRVHVQPGVVIVLGAGDTPGHHRGVLGPRRQVAGSAHGPPAALATGVHDEGGIADRGEQRVAGREPASAAVPDELHHEGQLGVTGPGRAQVPAADTVATSPGELHVVGVQWAICVRCISGDPGWAGSRARLVHPLRPPPVQAGRLLGRGAVFPQGCERQVEPGHLRSYGACGDWRAATGGPHRPPVISCPPARRKTRTPNGTRLTSPLTASPSRAQSRKPAPSCGFTATGSAAWLTSQAKRVPS